MAQVKGTDAVGGGSTVNKAWVNKVAEEKWAAEQEEKRRRERVEDQAAQNRAYNDANAQKQEQLAAQRRAQEQAAAQKAAQEKAQREAAIQAARQRAIEEQQRAAQAAADRAAEREERRQREAAAAQAEASRNLSYSGGGISQKNQDREAEWQDYMKPHAPKVSTTEAAEEPAAESESWKAPDNVAEVEVSTPRRSGENRAEAQAPKAPIVYTPQDTTEYSTTEARGMAANTKAALTEEESGMSPEQLAWLQTPEGQAALARQQAKEANDAALRAAAAKNQSANGNYITINGQPVTADKLISGQRITADKAISGQPMTAEEAARLAAVNGSIAAANAARNYRDGTPGEQRYVYQPAAANTEAAGYQSPAGTQEAESGTPTFREVLQGMANDWLLSRNGGTNQEKEDTLPETTAPTGKTGGVNTPTFGEVMQGMANDWLLSRAGGNTTVPSTAGAASTTPSATTPGVKAPTFGEVLNAIATGEYPNTIKRPASQAQKERQQAFDEAVARGEVTTEIPENGYKIPGTETYVYEPGAKTTKVADRPGADAALQEIMDKAAAAGLTYGGANQPAANETAAGSTTSKGSGAKSTGSNTGTGKNDVSNSDKAKGGKTTYFTPSYGQAMDKGVKLPYKAGGYTAAEIEAAGNKARSDQKYYTGDKAYEGYYLAPDGRYYPVDQEKAAYYKANGNSYKGWEEPMREYYNTFGTFYGYRPDWKTAGGKNVWKQNRTETPSRSYSYSNNKSLSYTPASSSRSYGRGSTANNGMYWNGLTSWNA